MTLGQFRESTKDFPDTHIMCMVTHRPGILEANVITVVKVSCPEQGIPSTDGICLYSSVKQAVDSTIVGSN